MLRRTTNCTCCWPRSTRTNSATFWSTGAIASRVGPRHWNGCTRSTGSSHELHRLLPAGIMLSTLRKLGADVVASPSSGMGKMSRVSRYPCHASRGRMTRCTECGATLTWYAGQQFQVCWSCAKVTKRVTKAEADPERPASHPSAVAVGDVPNSLPRGRQVMPERGCRCSSVGRAPALHDGAGGATVRFRPSAPCSVTRVRFPPPPPIMVKRTLHMVSIDVS